MNSRPIGDLHFSRILAENMRRLRRERGITAPALAAIINGDGHRMSAQSIHVLEHSRTKTPRSMTVDHLAWLAKAFDVPLASLLSEQEEGDMSAEEPGWKAELEAQIRTFDAFGMPFIVPILDPFIQAAEQRGRQAGFREALVAVQSEQLTDDTGSPDDAAYSSAMADAYGAVKALIDPDES